MKPSTLFLLIPITFALNSTNFIAPNADFFTADMQTIIKKIITENSKGYAGYLFVIVNEIDSDCIDFCLKHMLDASAVVILNMVQNTDVEHWISYMDSNTQFKFALVDPTQDVESSQSVFSRVRNIRTKTGVIFSRQPPMWMVAMTIQIYNLLGALNVVLIYDVDGVTEVYSTDAFVSKQAIKRLTPQRHEIDLFEDKVRNINGATVRALLTHPDKTKVNVEKTIDGAVEYSGKDVETIRTIFEHIGGKLEILDVNELVKSESNPWNPLVVMRNRDEMKKNIVDTFEISLLIKSDRFKVYDPVFEQVYPHTMNNLRVVVPRWDPEFFAQFFHGFSTGFLYFIYLIPIGVCILIERLIMKKPLRTVRLVYTFVDVFIINRSNVIFTVPFEYMLLLGWILFSSFLSLLFQGKYTSILSSSKYDNGINTVKDLINYDTRIYVQPNYAIELEKQYKSTKYEGLLKKFILDVDNEDETILNENITKNRLPFVTENDIATFCIRSASYYENQRPMFHLMHESVLPSFQSFQITYGNVLMPMFTKTVRILGEAGLIDLWAKRMIFEATIRGDLKLDEVQGEEFKAMSVDAAKMAFQLMFCGSVLAVIVFGVEVFWYWCVKKKAGRRVEFSM